MSIIKKIQYACVVILLATSNSFATDNKETDLDTFTFSMLETSDPAFHAYYEKLFTEACRRLGMQAQFKYYPNRRASEVANNGKVDGEPSRIIGYNKKFSNLIRVDVPIYHIKFNAYSKRADIESLSDWESLTGKSYKVGFRRGLRAIEQSLPNHVDKKQLRGVVGPVNGFKMLVADRIDVYVDAERTAFVEFNKAKAKGVRKVGLMEKISSYMHIHKKHKDLAPKFAKVLQDLTDEGKMAEYQTVLTPKL